MPARLIREDILTSDRIDQLDAASEVFYRRLLSKIDDFGCYDARISILRANLYPLRIDKVREADCSRWIAACEKAGLIALYEHESKPFLQVLRTRWQTRSEPKWPLPPWGRGEPLQASENSCAQPKATAPVFVFGDEGVVEDEGGNARKRATPTRRKVSMPENFEVSDRVKAWAAEKGYERLPAHLEAFKLKVAKGGYTYSDWDAALMEAVREDWAKLRGRAPNGTAPPPEHVDNGEAEKTAAYLAEQSATRAPLPEAVRAKLQSVRVGTLVQSLSPRDAA